MTKTQEEYLMLALKTPLFRGMEEEDAAALIGEMSGEVVSCAAGQTVTAEGEERRLMLLLSGMLLLLRYGEHGTRYILDYVLPGGIAGDAVGGKTALTGVQFTAGKPSRLLSLCLTEGEESKAYRQFEKNLLSAAREESVRLARKADIAARRTVRDKILTYLHYESARCGRRVFDIPLNRQELADYICVDRTTLSSMLNQLQREGVLLTDRNHFELLEPQE
ncbi:MAG: Crp/Fnr family transcriptional regulator [Oscillospiraceae bacterium]|nr:Crp/Fnr family transcriptional regulator [Oscillospiraceae bacterium]